MKTNIQLYDEETLKRAKPKNYSIKDFPLFKNEFKRTLKQVNIKVYKNAYFLPNGLCYKNKILFHLYFNKTIIPFKTKIKFTLYSLISALLSYKIVKISKAIILTDVHSHTFFHWFGDVAQKLEAISTNKLDVSAYEVLIPHFVLNDFVIKTLEIYKINYRVIQWYEKAHVKELVYVPLLATITGNFRPPLIRKIRRRFKKNYEISPDNLKIFISRSKALRRRIINERNLYRTLRKHNFEIVCMEDLNFLDQFKLISKAKTIVGLHGAGLTHMLWLNKNSNVLEIRIKGDTQSNCYFALASALKINYYYLLAEPKEGKSTNDNNINVHVDYTHLNKTLNTIVNKGQ